MDLAWSHGPSSTSNVKGSTYTTKATMLIMTRGICEPFIASIFPSSSQTAGVFPCLSVNTVRETEAMIVRMSFAYESRNRVAKTETVLEPLSLAMVVEYLY